MRSVVYLVIAMVFFALAFWIYWLAAESGGGAEIATRSIAPQAASPPGLMAFIQEWQPVLSLVSSLGGIVSLFFQLKVWVRSRA
jgi:hypothetical protein